MNRWIANTPRWLILSALVFAPWAYGATRPWAITGLNWILGAGVVTWLLAQLLSQQWPKPHPAMAVAGLALIAQAWFMVWNAKFEYLHLTAEFIPLEAPFLWLPGSLNRSLSFESATQLSLLLAAGFVFADMARHSSWRGRLLWTMAVTGMSIAILGLAQRFTNAEGIFWRQENFGPNFFATFRNHTNAGSFLNLIWPLTLAAALHANLRYEPRWKTILWSVATGLCLTALVVNTSRAATVIALLLAFVTMLWMGWRLFRSHLTVRNLGVLGVAVLLVFAVMGSLFFMAGSDANVGRWKQIEKQLRADNSRLLSAQVCLKMIPEAGWAGFGPGTFQTAFPYHTAEFGDRLRGRWIFAHQDYLQTITEWGYVGSASWSVLIGGSLIYSWRKLRRRARRGEISTNTRVRHFTVMMALAGVLIHALADFPLQIASIQLYCMALVSVLWSAEHWMHDSSRRTVRSEEVAPTQELACAA